MEKISFVIPCYRSAKTIGEVVLRIETAIKDTEGYSYEIVCVNDSSPDNTFEVLTKIAVKDQNVKVVNLARNFGQHAALMAGFHYISGDIVICLDDDGQNPPEEMFKLINKIHEGYDYASARYENGHSTAFRSLGTKISYVMSELLLGRPKEVQMNSYFAVKRFVIDEVVKYENAYPFVAGLILRVTHNVTDVDISKEARLEGRSGYSFRKLLALWMNGFTAFSEKPLRIASVAGIGIAVIGILFGAWVVIKKIMNPSVPMGYSSLMAVMLFTTGANMMFLGIIGEYIGRIYISINRAPQFVVRETINIDAKGEK